MIPLLLTSLAFAQDSGLDTQTSMPATDVETLAPEVLSKRGQKNRGRRGKQAKPDWKHRFYARPLVSGSTYTDGAGNTTTAVGLGGEGGIRYRQVNQPFPRLRGRTRATGQYIVSTNANGMEVKVGSFMGPVWEYVGLESGLDISWDRYEWDGVPMEATVGYGIPFIATTGVSIVTVYAGFQPTFLSNETRRVDWSETDEFGFGHQFSTFAGISLAIDDMNIGLGYTRTVSAAGGQAGVQQGYGITLGFRG